jgi:tetratricopeptide (TPR) repeat protein
VIPLAIAGSLIAVIGMVVLIVVLSASGDRQSGDDVRIDLWRSAIDMTLDYPLLGVGPGLFGRAWRTYRDPYFARDHLPASHNAYLNTSSETGLAGVVVSLWMAAALFIAWRRNWLAAESSARKLRLEAALGALIGLGVHSLVDVFTPTPVVLPILGLAAYCVTGHRTVLDLVPVESRLEKAMSLGLVAIIAGYGTWFVLRVDPAHLSSFNALRAPDVTTALADAQQAHELDPALTLYSLQIAYLRGIEAIASKEPEKIEVAIEAYESALALEPTWDGGWINLAALHLEKSDVPSALEHLDRARHINPLTNPASLHWAMLAEEYEAADPETITDAYYQVILNDFGDDRLPLASFWWQTPLRELALQRFLTEVHPRDVRYRVLAMYKPQTAELLVPDNPQTAADWWVVGQHALDIENDPEKAFEAFDRAVNLAPRTGDHYASRARVQATIDTTLVQRDLNMARLYGVRYETVGDGPVSVSSDDVNPGFTSALFSGRVLAFGVLPSMRLPYE